MSTIFQKIIDGEIPAYKVAENDFFLAFLDVNPLAKGHTLVIPKKATDYIFDMADNELAAMHVFAKQVAIGIKSVVPCVKVGVAVIGLEVPHAHIHLVPMNKVADLNFAGPRISLSKDEYEAVASAISQAITL
ncbi:MAG: HIT family protein [Bacteroidota bacterium]